MSGAGRKGSVALLIVIVGLLVVAVGAFVINKTGINFLFKNKAATGSTVTVTGRLSLMGNSTCLKKIPAAYRRTHYVLEGNFPVFPSNPTTRPFPRTSLITIVDAAPAPTTPKPTPKTSTRPKETPKPTPTPDLSFMRTCLPLIAPASQADALNGKMVTATGVITGTTFYATTVNAYPPVKTPTPKPATPQPVPTALPQSSCQKLGGFCVATSSCAQYGGNVGTGSRLCGNNPYSCCKSLAKITPVPSASAMPYPSAIPNPTAPGN